MKILIDTCVLSEVARLQGDVRVRRRLAEIPDDDFYLSVITIGELVRGIELLPVGARRTSLDRWVRSIEEQHGIRILPVDVSVAHVWGRVDAAARQKGITLPAADGLIAATALHHDFAVMTRNSGHFEATGVRLIDPWTDPSA